MVTLEEKKFKILELKLAPFFSEQSFILIKLLRFRIVISETLISPLIIAQKSYENKFQSRRVLSRSLLPSSFLLISTLLAFSSLADLSDRCSPLLSISIIFIRDAFYSVPCSRNGMMNAPSPIKFTHEKFIFTIFAFCFTLSFALHALRYRKCF